MVVLSCGDYGYQFGKIEFVIAENTVTPVLFVYEYETTDFYLILFVYRTAIMFKKYSPQKFKLCKLKGLLDHFPVDLTKTHGGHELVIHFTPSLPFTPFLFTPYHHDFHFG